MLDKVLTPEIKRLIKQKRFDEIKKIILSLLPEDAASLIEETPDPWDKVFLFRMIPAPVSVEVFEHLEPEEQKNIIFSLSDEKVKSLLNEMAVDERTELFEDLPAEIFYKLLKLLSPSQRKIAVEILGYPEDSVGRLITPDYVRLYEDMSVENALDHIRKVGIDTETIYNCYVLDKTSRLIGIVSLKDLVLAVSGTKVGKIMDKEVIKVNVYTDREEAAKIFKKYDLIALPVVDNSGKLLGIVTFDDFVDVLEEEATEDFEKIAAVIPGNKPYMESKLFSIIWHRSFWLIVLVLFESLSGFVLQHYSETIRRMVSLTFFLPLLIDAGGNAGTQSATVIIRGLATEEIKAFDFIRVIWRESLVGIFIGLILAFFGFLRALFQQGNWWLSVSVGISMGITILLSTTIGAMLPLVFRKLKVDPALMSGPLITTIVDVSGVIIYFETARLLLSS